MSLTALKEVFLAYLKVELIRSKGFVFGLLSLMLWLVLFLAPTALFRSPETPPEMVSTYALVAIAVFLLYSTATWDWAWELRLLMFQGVLEEFIASGRSVYILYAGILPVSFIWLTASLGSSYVLLTALLAPPRLSVADPLALAVSVATLVLVLIAYSLILGGTTIATGTSGPVMEFLGWIMPIATGGLTPLASLPEVLRWVAISTPFSYPAELLRYSLGLAEPVVGVRTALIVGPVYAVLFLALSVEFFEVQLRKLLKEGVKTAAMY